MRAGDILLIRGNTWISAVVRWLTKSSYTHVAIYTSKGQMAEADVLVPVRITSLPPRCTYDVISPSLTEQQRELILFFLNREIGRGYDYLRIIAYLLRLLGLRLILSNRLRYTCTELVCAAYRFAGLILFIDREEGDVLPVDFLTLLEER